MSLYGKLNNHMPRTNFNFTKVYPNREAMRHAVENKIFYTYLNEGETDASAINRVVGISELFIKDVVIIANPDDSVKATYIFDGTNWNVTTEQYEYDPFTNIAANSYLLVDYNSDGNYNANRAIDEALYGDNNFDLTVWQSQIIDEVPKSVAIARLHSILPTFEKCGEYRIDILAPTSGGDYFGKGKNIYVLTDNLPTGLYDEP